MRRRSSAARTLRPALRETQEEELLAAEARQARGGQFTRASDVESPGALREYCIR
jgi:hypothetical protein